MGRARYFRFLMFVMAVSACFGCSGYGVCGEYQILEELGDETCGGEYGGYGYTTDRVTNVFFTNDDSKGDSKIDEWLGFWQIWFDTGYLAEGVTLDSSNARALCSRLDSPSGTTYLVDETADFSAMLLSSSGTLSDEINGDVERWRISWDITCTGLDMSASGEDDVDLDPDGPNFPDLPAPPAAS